MLKYNRVIVIIIDGVGVGELPDAALYGDAGSDTLGNLARRQKGLDLPVLESLGLGCIHQIDGINCPADPGASYGKMAEVSAGKDSTTGHWELGGIILRKAFPTYPQGFPDSVINEFRRKTGFEILGNYPFSGTEIIKELGEEHIRSGHLIVYTSADSVFQIAAHEEVVPVKKLYEICQTARDLLQGEHGVARVIARPFTGSDRHTFVRTTRRKDFSLPPPGQTILNVLQGAGIPTVGIGKVNDLYVYSGIDISVLTKSNTEGMAALDDAVLKHPAGLIIANLVDFDMLYGHRNNCEGFAAALGEFDQWLKHFLPKIAESDILFITADHGNDPTTSSSDHSREYVPLLAFGPGIRSGINLGVRETFADLQATIAEIFSVDTTGNGSGFLNLINENKV